ncbi:hypothetical protein TrRE_jg6633 [Triparma retinervis]|uniref:Methyltransferase type 11 domain-containing protein n=1 Tax=Triparma retinervis TaxID=2557542 RepID=A0A9W6Z254_9STRA|nr:hypothetical protein TrRE_jg6633 [Triparma retinervis]
MAKPAAAALSSTSTTTSTQITPSPSTSSTSNAPDKLGGSLPLPKTNKAYGEHQYWEARFAEEEEFDWLVSYPQVSSLLRSSLPNFGSLNCLLVGCGNSTFSSDLYAAGIGSVTSLDYSSNVISAMKKKYPEKSDFKWVVGDMTKLPEVFSDGSFDVVIDKAAMDALMVNEGDVWNPDPSVVGKARDMCGGISRVLKGDGVHLHISFAQPHFRRKYLLGLHGGGGGGGNTEEYSEEFGWGVEVKAIEGEDGDGCFHHFYYEMRKGGR